MLPSPQEMARVILADETGGAFEAYYGSIRLKSSAEPMREDARRLLQDVADGRFNGHFEGEAAPDE